MRILIAGLCGLISLGAIAQPFDLVSTLRPDADSDFGNHTLIDGDTILVGWPHAFSGTQSPPPACGEVAVVENTGGAYQITATFSAPDCQANDVFGGGEMALAGDLLAVSQPTGTRVDGQGSPADSALQLFRRDATTAAGWTPVTTLRASDQGPDQGLSGFVRINGDYMAVTGYTVQSVFGFTFARANAVYIFERTGAGAGDWTQIQKLTTGSSTDFFGLSFDFAGDQLLVGASEAQTIGGAGRVHVYQLQNGRFQEAGMLPGVSDPNFGWYVEVDDSNPDRAVVTAINYTGSGAAYLFQRSGDTWQQVQRLEGQPAAATDLYGVYVRLRGDELGIGAENGVAAEVGRYYFYQRNGDDYQLVQTIEAANPSDGTFYASRFDFDDDQLAISANGAQVDGGTTAFFVYERESASPAFAVNPGVSGVWYNTGRDGEGVIVDHLDNGQVNVYWYTYDNDGRQLWLFGVGEVEGERVVISDLFRTSGPQFGEDYRAADLVVARWGSLTLSFDAGCNNASLSWDGPAGFGRGSHSLVRLAALAGVDCRGATRKVIANGNSGLFYDPERNGEGIQLQVLEIGGDLVPLVVWYTYDAAGLPIWIIATGVIMGDAMVFDEPTITTGARFGSAFDAADVVRSDFGSFRIELSGCDSLTFSYQAADASLGSGSRDYVRLSRLAGTACME